MSGDRRLSRGEVAGGGGELAEGQARVPGAGREGTRARGCGQRSGSTPEASDLDPQIGELGIGGICPEFFDELADVGL